MLPRTRFIEMAAKEALEHFLDGGGNSPISGLYWPSLIYDVPESALYREVSVKFEILLTEHTQQVRENNEARP